MELIPVQTKRLEAGDDIAKELSAFSFQHSDVVVVSSKAVATCEGRIIDLSSVDVSDEAKTYAEKTGRSPEFMQAVLDEVQCRNGAVVGTCPGALLTELKPEGLSEGTIFAANAGLDESNAKEGTVIGWPEDPVGSVVKLRKELEKLVQANSIQHSAFRKSNRLKAESCEQNASLAIIISDSCCRPRRWGITAFALTVSGLDPLQDEVGKKDLHGKELRITKEAVADQLATAANILMGNAGQSIPAVILRGHNLALSDYEGWVPGIAPEEDLFREVL